MTARLGRTTPREPAKLLTATLIALALSFACRKEGNTIYVIQNGGSAGASGNNVVEGGADNGGPGDSGSGGTSLGGDGPDTSAGGGSDGGQARGGAEAGGTGGITGGTPGSGGTNGGSTGTGGYPGALFVEDFEDGNYDGWALGPSTSTYAVSTATAANGSTHSMQISGGTGYFDGPNYMLGGIKPSKVSWWVYIADAVVDAGQGYFVLSSSTDVEPLIYCFMDQYAINFVPDVYVNTPVAMADFWHHFEVDIDWQAETYSVQMDGVAIGSGMLAGNTQFNGIQRVDIFNANASGGQVVYWDEIVMMP
jgi:hypothetical protein